MDAIISILGNVDKNILIGIAIILLVLFIISIIKKAIKLSILIAVVLAVNIFIIPPIQQYQEKYNFRIEDNVAMVTIDGRDISIDKETCQGIKLNGKNPETNTYSISLLVDGESIDFEVPKVIQTGIEKFAEKSDIGIEK